MYMRHSFKGWHFIESDAFSCLQISRYQGRPRCLKGTTSNRLTDGGDVYRQWLRKECFEVRGLLIPRDTEQTKRLLRFKARVRDLTMNVTVGKLCMANYNAGMHILAVDEWTAPCDLCRCKFHCREVMRVEAVEKHVFGKDHMKLLAVG